MQPYDVNAGIAKPNMLEMVNRGMQYGQQQRALREEREDKNALRTLAPQILAGDQDAYGKAYAIDPQAADQAQQSGDNQLRRLKGGMDYLKAAMESGNPQRIAAAEAQVGPYVSRMAGKPWQPGSLTADPAAFEQAYAKIAMLGQEAKPQEGKVVGNSLVDPVTGRVIYQGPDVPVNAQIVKVPDGRGGFQDFMFDPRTRQLMDLPAPGGGPAKTPQQGPLRDFAIDASQAEVPFPTDPSEIAAAQLAMTQPGTYRVENGKVLAGESAGLRQPVPQPAANRPPTLDRMPMSDIGGGAIVPPARFGYTPPKAADAPEAVVTLTPDEVVAAGFPPGSVVQRKPDGTLVKTFSPTERDTNGGRALPANVVNELSKDAEKLVTLTDLATSFKDGFAGNVAGGSIENAVGRLGGERFGLTTQGQSEWWQQYDRLKNVVRNELFGAALTATEQAAFEAADITPNMDPKIVTSNLKKQADIVRRALERKAAVWKSQGYNPDAVINATAVPSAAPGASAADMSDDEIKKALNL